MEIMVIRHGKTKSNEKKVFIGKTDESLSEKGIDEIKKNVNIGLYKEYSIVYSSPMKRCLETANLIFPDKEIIIDEDFKEVDFGDYEGLSGEEMYEHDWFRDFGKTGNDITFKNGDNMSEFKSRCTTAFQRLIDKGNDCALVCHGGVIMALFEAFSHPKKSFYDGFTSNGNGFLFEIDMNKVIGIHKLL